MTTHHSEFNSTPTSKGGARPMKVYVDSQGYEWLCDNQVDPNGDLASQGCWRTDQMHFDRNF